MNAEREEWVNEVLQSKQGIRRAKPRPDLFADISDRISTSGGKVIPIFQWKYAISAAAIILLINVSALFYYNKNSNDSYSTIAVEDTYGQSIVSSYQIYE